MPGSSGVEEISFDGWMRGTVVNNVDDRGEGRVGLFIRKIMTKNQPGEAPAPESEQPLRKEFVGNEGGNAYSEGVSPDNMIWARPVSMLDASPTDRMVTNEVARGGGRQQASVGAGMKSAGYVPGTGSYSVPRIGTTVYVFFEDGDPQKAYYLPFSPTLSGQVTPMKFVESRGSVDSMSKRVNVTVLRELPNGTVVYADANEEKGTFVIRDRSGHRVKVQDCPTASGVVVDTAYGHQLKLVDKSSPDGADNPKDANDEDGVTGGKYAKLQTPAGHHVLLDDNGGKEKVRIRSKSGHTVLLDDVSKEIHVETAGGSKIVMKDGQQIEVKTADTIKVEAGNAIILKAKKIKAN